MKKTLLTVFFVIFVQNFLFARTHDSKGMVVSMLATIVFIGIIYLIKFIKSDKQTIENVNIDGVYSNKDDLDDILIEITINGNSWTSKTIMKTDVSSEFDIKNAQYGKGIVKGNGLYNIYGEDKIGDVSDNIFTSTLKDAPMMLKKELMG